MSRPPCVLIAPWATRTPDEDAATTRAMLHLLALGWAPIFLPWALAPVLTDADPGERATSQSSEAEQASAVARDTHGEAFQLPGRETEGMTHDREAWERYRAAWSSSYRAAGSLSVPLPATVRTLTWTEADAPGGRR